MMCTTLAGRDKPCNILQQLSLCLSIVCLCEGSHVADDYFTMLGCEPVHILNNQLVPSATFHRIHGLGEPSSLGSFLCHGGFQCFAVQGGGNG
jgi:hypothetical protein